jgi:hypothetical protein
VPSYMARPGKDTERSVRTLFSFQVRMTLEGVGTDLEDLADTTAVAADNK